MKDSPLHSIVVPILWIPGCIALLLGVLTVTVHLASGVWPFLFGQSHRWQTMRDWKHSLIEATWRTAIYLMSGGAVLWWRRRRSASQSRQDTAQAV